MKTTEKLNVVALCWEWSRFPFNEIDRGFGFCGREVWSDTCYAETRSKARYSAFLSMEGDVPFTEINVRRKKDMDKVLLEPHPLVSKLTSEQVELMKHAYGFDSMQPGFRNHFVANNPQQDWEDLVEKGLASSRPYNQSDIIYHLTELGQTVIRSLLPVQRGVVPYILQLREKK